MKIWRITKFLMGKRYRGLLEDIFDQKNSGGRFFALSASPDGDRSDRLRPKAAIAGMCFRPCRNSAEILIGKRKAKTYRDLIIEYLEKHYMPELSKHIISEHYIDPLHFEGTLNSYLGSAFSVAPTLMQSAYLRPHNV